MVWTTDSRRRPPRPRFRVEFLEDRSVPAALAVADLAHLVRDYDAFALSPPTPAAFVPANPLLQTRGGSVAVEALTADPAAAASELAALGFDLAARSAYVVSGYLPIASLTAAAALPSVRSLVPAYRPLTSAGQVTSQGVRAVGSEPVNKYLQVDGTGVTVGVLSDSYNALGGAASDVAGGDLPGAGNPNGRLAPVNVLSDGPGRDEGRAMLQIVHDVAPGAGLAFAAAGVSQTQFAAAIIALANAGAEVIVDDVTFPAEPFFQDGPAAQAVDRVTKVGVTYFSAAGNLGRNAYESTFRDSGLNLGAGGTGQVTTGTAFHAHDFDPGPGRDPFQTVTLFPGDTVFSFQWEDPYFSVSGGSGARTDLDLAVFDMDGNFLSTVGGFTRNVGGDPVEVFTLSNTTAGPVPVQLAVGRVSGPVPGRIKYVALRHDFRADEYATDSGTVFGHANAAGAIAVGAVGFDQTPAYTGRPPAVRPSSSAGGTDVRFDADGNPHPSARGGTALVAPDGVATTFFGEAGPDGRHAFFGTSAAAPHAAGVAALVLQANRSLKPADVRAVLQATAVNAGPDGGAGLVRAAAAVYAAGGPFDLAFDGTHAADALLVRRTAGGEVALVLGGVSVFTAPEAEVKSVTVRGLGGDDILTADFGGGDFAAGGGLRLDGGGGTDTAAVLGSAGNDAFAYAPLAADAGQLDRTGGKTTRVTLVRVERAGVEGRGQATADALTVTAERATVLLDRQAGAGTVVPGDRLALAYTDVERPAVHADDLTVPATPYDDSVRVTADGLVALVNAVGYENGVWGAGGTLHVPLGDGRDYALVSGRHPYSGIRLDGGSPTGPLPPDGPAGDTLMFDGTGGAVSLDPGGGVLSEAGSGPVRYTDFEGLRAFTAGGPPGVVAGAGGVLITPVTADEARVTTAGGTMTVAAAGGVLTVSGGAGADDRVTVQLPAEAVDVAVSADGVISLPGYLSIAVGAGVEVVRVDGNGANNTFAVAPSPQYTLTVDGGAGEDRLFAAGRYPSRPAVGSGTVPSTRPVHYRSFEGVVLGEVPEARDDGASAEAGRPVVIDVLANDGGLADGPLTVAVDWQPGRGTAAVVGNRVVYTPAADAAVGPDGFLYRVTDANGDTSTALVSVFVTPGPPPNRPPVVAPDVAATPAGSPVRGRLLDNDADPDGDALSAELFTPPAHGTVVLDPDGGFVYLPAAGFAGTDGFSYRAADGRGGFARAAVAVSVLPPAEPPPPETVIVTGAGAGGGPHVKVFDARTGGLRSSFFAYAESFAGGVRVAAGDVNGDGVTDVITGTGPGGAAHVKVFDGVDMTLLASFYAFELSFTGGVTVAAGDLDGDGRDEVVVGAGPGAGPHVKTYRLTAAGAELVGGPAASFFAFESTFTGGANVAVGNFDGRAGDELIVGATVGGGPRVVVFDARTGGVMRSFFAFPDTGRLGVTVSAADLDGDGLAEIITGPGDGGGPVVRVFAGGTAGLWREAAAFDPDFRGGVWVGSVTGSDGTAEVLVAPGRDSRTLQLFDGRTFDRLNLLEVYDSRFPGGVFVAGG